LARFHGRPSPLCGLIECVFFHSFFHFLPPSLAQSGTLLLPIAGRCHWPAPRSGRRSNNNSNTFIGTSNGPKWTKGGPLELGDRAVQSMNKLA